MRKGSGVIFRTRFGARLRALKDDSSGFSLIESIVSVALMLIFLSSLLGSVMLATKTTLANRTRVTGTTVGSEYVEKARSLTFASLKVLDSGGVPASKTVNGVSYPVVKGTPCPGCLQYQFNVVRQGITYSVTQLVLQKSSYTDEQGVVQTDKLLLVDVTWNVPRPASFSTRTIIHNKDVLPKPVAQGVRIEVVDVNGAVIEAESAEFDVSIVGPSGNVATGATAEGVYQNFALASGSYTCTLTKNATSQTYHPQGSSAGTSSSHACVVTTGNVTLVKSTWIETSTCPGNGANGSLEITILDPGGAPISGATVTLTPAQGGGSIPSQVTAANGKTTFTRAPGEYNFSATKTGYAPGGEGNACIFPALTSTATGTLVPLVGTPLTMTIKQSIKNEEGATKTYQITALHQGTQQATVQTLVVGKGKTLISTFANMQTGTYTLTICVVVTGNCNQLTQVTDQAFTTPALTYTVTYVDKKGGV